MAVLVGVVVPYSARSSTCCSGRRKYLEDVRERELEIKAMEDRLSKRDLHCPVCRSEVDSSYLVCPICTTKLKQACSNCKAPARGAVAVCRSARRKSSRRRSRCLARTRRRRRAE